MIDFSSARRMMLDGQLRAGGVTDLKVLSAFNSIPREDFVPEARRSIAYSDSAHPLPSSGAPRSLAAPAIFARLLQLATIAPGDRIFDFCAGNGYSSAVLAALGADVLAYEADDLLAQAARANLQRLGLSNVEVVSGEIAALNDRIFDVIVAENTLEREPDELFSMLAPRGRLVALVGSGAVGTAFVFTRDNGNVTRHPAFNAGLPPRFAAATGSDFVL